MTMLKKVGLIALVLCVMASPAVAQPSETVNVSDTISSNGDSFIVNVRGMASLRLQTLDTYSGTWEVQCSADGGRTYDTDDEVNLFLEGTTAAAVQAVTDTVGIWTASIAGCTHIKIISTADFAATDTVIVASAITSGGSSGGGGGGSSVTLGTTDADDASIAAAQTNSNVNALNMAYDGSVWRRLTFYANDTTATGTTWLPALTGLVNTSAPTYTAGRMAAPRLFAGGSVGVVFTDAAGATLSVATDVTEDAAETAGGTGPMSMSVRRDTAASSAGTTGDNATVNTNAEGGLWASNMAASNGGCTIGTTTSIIGGASVNETQVKATAGQIYSISAFSLDATPVYLKLYNDTAANIDETDTPVYRLMIPAATTASLGSGLVFNFGVGLEFTTAITFRVTTGIADNSTGALTADEVLINVCYQ